MLDVLGTVYATHGYIQRLLEGLLTVGAFLSLELTQATTGNQGRKLCRFNPGVQTLQIFIYIKGLMDPHVMVFVK